LHGYCSYQRNKKNGEEFPLHGHLHCWLPKIVATFLRPRSWFSRSRAGDAALPIKACRAVVARRKSQLKVFLRSKSAEVFPGVTSLLLSKP
jgi:hypothetical protein